MEELRELKRYFSIVGLFTVIESLLRRTLGHLRKLGAPVEGRIRKIYLEGMKDAFRKIGVPITEPNHDWHALMGMKSVRNCIAHYDGHPHKGWRTNYRTTTKSPQSKSGGDRRGESEPVSWRMQLADEYWGRVLTSSNAPASGPREATPLYVLSKNLSR